MHTFLSFLAFLSLSVVSVFAAGGEEFRPTTKPVDGSLFRDASSWNLVTFLTFAEGILLKVVLPLVVVGAALYMAYELLTAEGNEEKMKRAWKSLAFSAIGVISVMLAYALVTIISQLSL